MRIGLAGAKEAGKSTAAEFLSSLFGLEKVSFSDYIFEEIAPVTAGRAEIPCEIITRTELSELHGLLIRAKLHKLDPRKDKLNPVMRRALQLWGTEYRRASDPDYWVKQVTLKSKQVFENIRFRNEFALCDQVWYVYNRVAEINKGDHCSEHIVSRDMCHLIIDNNGNLDGFKSRLARAYSGLHASEE